jgi:protein ImuB
MERLLAVWIPTLSEEKPDGSSLRSYLEVLDALSVLCPFTEPVRLGLLVLPLRGPSRFFGGEEAVLATVSQSVRDLVGCEPSLGVADGLFCAELAAREGMVVPVGATESFRRAQPISVLGRKDLTTTCRRLGLHTLGAFADLERARVAERFSTPVLALHRVARGEVGEMAGQRDPRITKRLRTLRGEDEVGDEQIGFFGQRGAGDDRAQAAAYRVRNRLGADAVVVASLRGGRVPEDRATLVPFGSPASAAVEDAPWPGQFRAPAPAMTLAHRVAVQLHDETGQQVAMGSRGLLSATPASLLFSSQARRDVIWHAGPWPLVERWWVLNRRRAHLQVVLATGEAVLLVAESGRWWVVGIYD